MKSEENRTRRRDRARQKRKHGMRVSGKGLGLIMRDVLRKRAREAEEQGTKSA